MAAVVAVAMPLRAVTGVGATAGPPGTSDGSFDGSNPYAVITDRNIFHLNPPPPPVSDADKKAKEVPKVFLNGIVSVGDDVRVLFSIPPKDSKGQTAYFKLGLGERDDVLELVRIHPNRQEVDVLVNGTPVTLSMLSNSLAAASVGKTAEAPAPPGGPRGRPTAAAPAAPEGSSAIIAGKTRESSPYGNVAVSGGGGATTIGGGGFGSSGGGGVTISGGGGSFGGAGTTGGGANGGGAASYGGGVSVGGGGSTFGQQIGNLLTGGGTASSGLTSSGMPQPIASPEQIESGLINMSMTSGMPLPPQLAQKYGLSGSGEGGLPGFGGPPSR